MAGVLLRRAAGAVRTVPSSWRSNVSLCPHHCICLPSDWSLDVKVLSSHNLPNQPRRWATAAIVVPPFYPGQMFILPFGSA